MNEILNEPLTNFKGFGLKICSKLERLLNIRSLKDLLFYFPRTYEDFREIRKIKDLIINEKNTTQGKVIETTLFRSPIKKMYIFNALIDDGSGQVQAIWFNQPFMARNIKKGMKIIISGKVKLKKGGLLSFVSPIFEILKEKEDNLIHSGRIVPIYPETEGISSRFLRFLIKKVLPYCNRLKDPLPEIIIKKQKLPILSEALEKIHFPQKPEEAASSKKRFLFEKLFFLQLYLQRENLLRKEKKAIEIKIDKVFLQNFIDSLPFILTKSQKEVLTHIIRDLKSRKPMTRLLQGEVGSGKTIIAIITSLLVVKNGFQVAMLVPTEILAIQHFKEFIKRLSSFNLDIALLTNKFSLLKKSFSQELSLQKNKLIELINNGRVNIVIGTHAILEDALTFENIGLIIIDEQQRFGVEQRSNLLKKASLKKIKTLKLFYEDKKLTKTIQPHLLSISATPIPRTLALTIYGDLEISRLKELPKDRKSIITKIVKPEERNDIYEFIKKEFKKGHQAFVICPLIEESEKLETKAAKEVFETLKNGPFKNYKVALIHGKIEAKDKDKIMMDFIDKKIDLLVATPVIEVGIDVPNATVIVIEGAERFGLAQLHQLRGRVGRGKAQSYCFLFMEKFTKTAYLRMLSLQKSNDGFYLAERDLKIRGPGDFLGTRQHGFPDIMMEALGDLKLTLAAKTEAHNLLKDDLMLKKFPYLKKEIEQIKAVIHLE